MIKVYKIPNGRYDRDAEMQLPQNDNNTRGHEKKLYKEQNKTKIRNSQFRLRMVNTWGFYNIFGKTVPSIKSFETILDQFWANQPIRFDHE